MDKLVYTALGAIVNQTAQRVQLTNDLANVSTIGYKRSISARNRQLHRRRFALSGDLVSQSRRN